MRVYLRCVCVASGVFSQWHMKRYLKKHTCIDHPCGPTQNPGWCKYGQNHVEHGQVREEINGEWVAEDKPDLKIK